MFRHQILIKTLITSKIRVKLLLKFFLNPQNSGYLRGLSEELEETTNAVRLELNRLESANMLHSSKDGKKMFMVNKLHPLFKDVNQTVRKHVGIDLIIENILKGLREPTKIYLTGDLAEGRNSDLADIVIVGKVNKNSLTNVIEKTEKIIERKIRYIYYTEKEFSKRSQNKNQLLIWSKDKMKETLQSSQWHVLYTKLRHEVKALERLTQNGFEVYCPMKTTLKQWSDRKKSIRTFIAFLPIYKNNRKQTRHSLSRLFGIKLYILAW